MQKKAIYVFHGGLNDFLSRKNKLQEINHCFNNSPVVKDPIESLGIPHPEVAIIKANGNQVDFSYKVNNNDRLDIYPYLFFDNFHPIIPLKPVGKPSFILDVHLGGLAKYLRMAGFDVLYNSEDWGDKYIADTGGKENRIVLSRDIGLLKRSSVVYGYFVRNKDSYKQFEEIATRYTLHEHFAPFTRCIRCNGEIMAVEKQTIENLLEEGTKREHKVFWQCTECQQVYWKGSHYKRMVELISERFNN